MKYWQNWKKRKLNKIKEDKGTDQKHLLGTEEQEELHIKHLKQLEESCEEVIDIVVLWNIAVTVNQMYNGGEVVKEGTFYETSHPLLPPTTSHSRGEKEC